MNETLPTLFSHFILIFCLDTHPGASRKSMEAALILTRKSGLKNFHWAGFADINGAYPLAPRKFLEMISYT